MITYNQEDYIGACLDSILSQSCDFPFEIIVGEDCSTDRTAEIVREYERKHPGIVHMITGDKNIGLVANVCRSEAAANGEYLGYCGGDDLWHDPHKLQKQVRFLESNPSCGAVHTEYHILRGETLTPNANAGKNVPTGWVYEDLLEGCFPLASSMVIRSSLIREFAQSPFAKRCYAMEDYPRWLFASRLQEFGYIPDACVTYRRLKGSITYTSADRFLRFARSSQRVRDDFIEAFGCSEQTRRLIRRFDNDVLLLLSLHTGDAAMFRTEYEWMRKNNPAWARTLRRRLAIQFMRLGLTGVCRLLARLSYMSAR